MEEDKIIDEFGIEFAIENISAQISKTIDEYVKNKTKETEKKLLTLLQEKEKIYTNDRETIKKYIKGTVN